MVITHSAAKELLRSSIAMTKGLPSPEFLDDAFVTFRRLGSWFLGDDIFLFYTPSEDDLGFGVYELKFMP